jgi:CheY-like chemotaxis protein
LPLIIIWRNLTIFGFALTSSDEERDRVKSYEDGANSFVRKPLGFTEYAETTARPGICWLAVNKPPIL